MHFATPTELLSSCSSNDALEKMFQGFKQPYQKKIEFRNRKFLMILKKHLQGNLNNFKNDILKI